MKLKSLLTILDKPKHPQTAFDCAMELQSLTGAHVDLVGFCWHAMAEAKGTFDHEQRSALKREIMRARKEWQRQLVDVEPFRSADISLQTIWAKNIADWTINRLQETSTDLVIKTAHRSRSLIHTPEDWTLLQRSPVPLLLTTHKPQKRSRRVVAAIDLNNESAMRTRLNRKVLKAAHAFAEFWGGEVHCVSVIEYSSIEADLDMVDLGQHKKQVLHHNRQALSTLAAPLKLKRNQAHFPTGKAGQRVSELSEELNADLLVVGTHSQKLKERMHLGTTAERILTKARCDVLAVPP